MERKNIIFKKIKMYISYIFWHIINLFSLRRCSVGYRIKIRGKLIIQNDCLFNTYLKKPRIIIGNNVVINSGAKYNLIGGDNKTILRTIDNGLIKIGDNTGISNSTIVSQNEVRIGRDVLIGGSTKIYDTDFHSLDSTVRKTKPTENINSKSINIEDGVFIGYGSLILKGVKIGKNSVVGAGSVVRSNIPANEIWAGNPARFIRKTR